MKFLGTDRTRDIKRDMYDYMPKIYEDLRESRAIVTSESEEFESYAEAIADVLAQFYVNTATWGLADWERRVGITPDESKPVDQRRSVVKSKLRGAGIVTKDLIKNVAESYSNGEVELTEDNANYTVIITFTGTLGVPPNIEDLQRVIRETLPAHLDVAYEYSYVLYSVLETQFADYDALATSGLTYDQILTNGG